MNNSTIIALASLSLLLPLQISCTPVNAYSGPSPVTNNANTFTTTTTEPVVSNCSGMANPVNNHREGEVISCVGLVPPSDNNQDVVQTCAH